MDFLQQSRDPKFFSFLDRDSQGNALAQDLRSIDTNFGEIAHMKTTGFPHSSLYGGNNDAFSMNGLRGHQFDGQMSILSQYPSLPAQQRSGQYNPPYRHPSTTPSSFVGSVGAVHSPAYSFRPAQQLQHRVPPGFIGRVNAAQPTQLHQLQQQQHPNFEQSETVYRVQFKQKIRNHLISQHSASPSASFRPGSYVMVETERRGMDVGMVVSTLPLTQLLRQATVAASRGDDEYGIVQTGRIVRSATQFEVQQLAPKYRDEAEVMLTAQILADEQDLPVQVLDAEYQFDRQLLTIYYSAEVRVDFRGWVRELFERYRARVWMKQLFPSPEERMRQKYEFRRAQNIQHAQAGGAPMSRMVGWNPHGYEEQPYQQQCMPQEQQQQQQARKVGAEHSERPLGFCRRPNDPLDIEHDEFRFHDAVDDHHHYLQQQLSQLGGLQQLGIEKQQQQQQSEAAIATSAATHSPTGATSPTASTASKSSTSCAAQSAAGGAGGSSSVYPSSAFTSSHSTHSPVGGGVGGGFVVADSRSLAEQDLEQLDNSDHTTIRSSDCSNNTFNINNNNFGVQLQHALHEEAGAPFSLYPEPNSKRELLAMPALSAGENMNNLSDLSLRPFYH